MTRPRSDDRSGASSRSGADASPDLAALRRELYRPGADRAALEAYLAAAPLEPGPEAAADPPAAAEPGAATDERQEARRRTAHWPTVTIVAVLVAAVLAAGVALLPRAAPRPAPTPSPSAAPQAVAPTVFDGLRGGSTLLVALPFRTERVRIRLICGGRRAAYGFTALGQDSQSEVFVPVLRHSGRNCSPGATYESPLPGDVSALRILVTVDGPYALAVEPL